MGDVVITTREVYDKVLALHEEVKAMHGEVKIIADHESRLRSIERRLWVLAGVATGAGAGLAEILRIAIGA